MSAKPRHVNPFAKLLGERPSNSNIALAMYRFDWVFWSGWPDYGMNHDPPLNKQINNNSIQPLSR